MTAQISEIEVEKLAPDPSQPRKAFVREEIERLADSIRSRGLLQPLRVLWDPVRQNWRIICGESRWHAARLAGCSTLPCIVVEGMPAEEEILADQLVENCLRNDLKPIEVARGLSKLKALKRCSSKALAEELGLSSATITRAEAILLLPDEIQEMIDRGQVPESVGYEISRLSDPVAQRDLARAVAEKRLSRDDVAQNVRNQIGPKRPRQKPVHLHFKSKNGSLIHINGQETMTLKTMIQALAELRQEARDALRQGLDLTGFAASLPK